MKNNLNATILFLHIGVDLDKRNAHDDYFKSIEYIKSNSNIHVIERNFISDDLSKTFEEYNICSIDTHHLSLWQKKWDIYKPRFDLLKKLADKYNAIIINDLSMFEWNISKAHYMPMLEKNGVDIVPTEFIHPDDLSSTRLSDIVKKSSSGIVIKPSIGMRASGITFIERTNNEYRLTIPSTPDNTISDKDVKIHSNILSEEELNAWFFNYATNMNGESVLAQQFITERKEVSVIFIEGAEPYAILRTQGKETGVAHEAFGGKNIPLIHIPQDLINFSKGVISAMPPKIKSQPMHRIDVLITSSRENKSIFMLLEIESAGPRLFVPESGTYSYLPDLLIRTAKRQNEINKNSSATEPDITGTHKPIKEASLTETFNYLNFVERAQLSSPS